MSNREQHNTSDFSAQGLTILLKSQKEWKRRPLASNRQALSSAQWNQESVIDCTHPTPRADQSTTAVARSRQPQRPADDFGGPQSEGGPSPRSAEKAASARPACIRPGRLALSLTPSHAPESTGATTHPAPQGRGSPGQRGAVPPQRARQGRQLRQVSSSWTLLLQPAAANTRAPPESVPLLRGFAAPLPGSCETLPGTSEKSRSHHCPVQRQPSATRMERAGKDRRRKMSKNQVGVCEGELGCLPCLVTTLLRSEGSFSEENLFVCWFGCFSAPRFQSIISFYLLPRRI
ncbi:uncharacterized protein LOC115275925 [Suricata suricatta]|uniref:uncharacterized protein LOC115275925 n=1 Tax=Suricata suricatta TaxID=37032 RepID=UPI001155A9AB|nr:uncharacterized protein LOC115275925 [Suricata suricatta]